jgi:hypothetical protein
VCVCACVCACARAYVCVCVCAIRVVSVWAGSLTYGMGGPALTRSPCDRKAFPRSVTNDT